MQEKVIGVVAGVGPFAGLDLLQKILGQTMAGKDQDHLTLLSLSQPKDVLDRTEYLLGQVSENPAYALAAQIKRLAQMGAEVVGIPCNTAHAPPIFDLICEEVAGQIKLLHMIEEVARFLRERHPAVQRVGILSTTGTYKARVYPSVLAPLGFTAVTTPRAMQENQIHPAIYHPEYGVKACGTVTEQARTDLMAGVRMLQEAGAQAIVLGCTEIPLVITETQIGATIIVDPTLILARALIRHANPAKLKPF